MRTLEWWPHHDPADVRVSRTRLAPIGPSPAIRMTSRTLRLGKAPLGAETPFPKVKRSRKRARQTRDVADGSYYPDRVRPSRTFARSRGEPSAESRAPPSPSPSPGRYCYESPGAHARHGCQRSGSSGTPDFEQRHGFSVVAIPRSGSAQLVQTQPPAPIGPTTLLWVEDNQNTLPAGRRRRPTPPGVERI